MTCDTLSELPSSAWPLHHSLLQSPPAASLTAVSPAVSCTPTVEIAASSDDSTETTAGYRALMGRTRSLVTLTSAQFPLVEQLRVAARHNVTVLLVGETGSGKTHLARLIHEASPRCDERFLTIACGALPGELVESELFGHVKGAFTGADRAHEGKFAAVGGGTLLMDEIDVLPLEQQTKLLRVIETGEYEPVGSNETRRTQARIIVASNRPLEPLTQTGAFRLDLYYRLDVLRFQLAPLRERKADIPYLARQFALAHGKTHGVEIRDIAPDFFTALALREWPGNIRELENVVRRAVLYCHDGCLRSGDLPVDGSAPPVPATAPDAPLPANAAAGQTPDEQTLEEQMAPYERLVIQRTLEHCQGHRSETARRLGVSRVTLYNKMRRLGLLKGRN